MTRLQPRRRPATRPPVLLRLVEKDSAPIPKGLPAAYRFDEPVHSGRSGSNADSPYPRSDYSPAPYSPDSPNSKIRYNTWANVQLQNELNATLPVSPGPVTPRGPVRTKQVRASSAPSTQDTYPKVRPVSRSSVGDRIPRDRRPIGPFGFSRPAKPTPSSRKSADNRRRSISLPRRSDSPTPATQGPLFNALSMRPQGAGHTRTGDRHHGHRPARIPRAGDITTAAERLPHHGARAISPRRVNTRPPGVTKTTTPAARDSYPGPFKLLKEYTEEPETRPGFEFRRESRVRQPDNNAAPTGLGIWNTPAGNVRRSKSPSVPSTKIFPVVTPISDFPDGGLDLDVNMLDDVVPDDLGVGTADELARCQAENKRLMDEHVAEIAAQKAEYDIQLEVAEIEKDQLREQHQDAEDRLFDLQQQLDDAKAQASDAMEGDSTMLIDNNDMHLAQIASLTEQLNDANDRVDEIQIQLLGAHRKVDTLMASRDGAEAATVDDEFVQELLASDKDLRQQIAALQTESQNGVSTSGKQQTDDSVYIEKRKAEMQTKADRLDALWDTLRNFQDMDDSAGEKNALQARITHLEAALRNAKAHINGTGGVENVEDDEENREEIVRLNGEIKDLTSQLQDASDSLATARDTIRFWREGGPEFGGNLEEPSPSQTYPALVAQINDLTSERQRLLVEIDGLEQDARRTRRSTSPADTIPLLVQQQEDIAATDAEILNLNRQLAEMFNKYRTSQATNKKLMSQVAEVQGIVELLNESAKDMNQEKEDAEDAAASLRIELQAAQEEIEALRDERGDVESLRDSGFVEQNTPLDQSTALESDELPQAKRIRRSTFRRNSLYRAQDEEDDLDDLISPSSFLESEASPHTPTFGKTRSASRSPEGDGENEAQFRSNVAAATPADPRGGVVVISRRETARALRAAKISEYKRKRDA